MNCNTRSIKNLAQCSRPSDIYYHSIQPYDIYDLEYMDDSYGTFEWFEPVAINDSLSNIHIKSIHSVKRLLFKLRYHKHINANHNNYKNCNTVKNYMSDKRMVSNVNFLPFKRVINTFSIKFARDNISLEGAGE